MYFVGLILFCCVIGSKTTTALNSRSVNVNLETVLEFDPTADVQLIDDIQQFLGKVKTAINNNAGRRSHRKLKATNDYKFTNFIKSVIAILKTYSDEDLEDVVAVIDDEIRKYHYKGGKFHELVQNGDLRRYVAGKLSTVQNKDGKYIKKSLDNLLDALENAKFDYKHVELLDYISSLYRHADMHKMKSFLNQMQAYKVKSKRANLDLLRIIRNGIRSIIFDHYSNLNLNARKELKIKIESFWRSDKESAKTTTTMKKFNIANGFDFLRDFTFEFITPESFTTKSKQFTTSSTKPTLSKVFVDLTERKIDRSPEEMPNYTDNEESNVKRNKKKVSKQKAKRLKIVDDVDSATTKKSKKKKNKDYKRKKDSHVTVVDENITAESKHKSKKHKKDYVFRQHDVEPIKVFDYKGVINVRGQSDESDSSEVWKPNEGIRFARDKNKSKKVKTREYRKNIAPNSEAGLSIDFTPMPINLSLNTEHTTKQDEHLQRRLNNLENVAETFKSKVKNDSIEVTKVTLSNITETTTTVKTVDVKQLPTTKTRKPVALAYVDSKEVTKDWYKQTYRAIKFTTETHKHPTTEEWSTTTTEATNNQTKYDEIIDTTVINDFKDVESLTKESPNYDNTNDIINKTILSEVNNSNEDKLRKDNNTVDATVSKENDTKQKNVSEILRRELDTFNIISQNEDDLKENKDIGGDSDMLS